MRWIAKQPHRVLILYTLLAALFLLLISLRSQDDLLFHSQATAHDFHLLSYLRQFYFTWGGRVFLMTPLFLLVARSIFFWRICNAFMIFLTLYSLSRIVNPEGKYKQRIDLFICAAFTLINYQVSASSIYGFTNSFSYLWPVACALFAILPFQLVILGKTFRRGLYFLSIPAAVFAANQEQVAAVLLCFSLLLLSYIYFFQKMPVPLLSLQTFFTLSSALFLYLAPGNYVRFQAEIKHWYPGFDQLGLSEKSIQGYRYIIDHLFHHETALAFGLCLLLFLLWTQRAALAGKTWNPFSILWMIASILVLLMACGQSILAEPALFLDKVIHRDRGFAFSQSYRNLFLSLQKIVLVVSHYEKAIIFTIGIALTLYLWKKRARPPFVLFAGLFSVLYLFALGPLQNLFHVTGLLNADGDQWSGWLLTLLLALLLFSSMGVWRSSAFALYNTLLFVAGFVSAFILSFSPTIYASGPRIFYVMDVMWIIFAANLFVECLEIKAI